MSIDCLGDYKIRIEEARKLRNESAPLRMGICCCLCKAWDWEKKEGTEAPCKNREEMTDECQVCGLFEDDEGDRPYEISQDLFMDLMVYRRVR